MLPFCLTLLFKYNPIDTQHIFSLLQFICMFQQNSTKYIVTLFSFQFGYIFVTVVLHHKNKQKNQVTKAFFIHKKITVAILFLSNGDFKFSYCLATAARMINSFASAFLICVLLTILLLLLHLLLESVLETWHRVLFR